VHLSSFFLMTPRPPLSTLFPYTTLFRSVVLMTGDSPQRIGATAFARSVAAPGIAFYVEYKLRLDCAQSRLSLCSNRAKQNRGVSLASGAKTLGGGGFFLRVSHQRWPNWPQVCAQSNHGLLEIGRASCRE